MKISSQLKIIATIAIATVLAIGFFLSLVSQRGEKESREAGIADEMVRDMAELGSLTSEYVLYNNDRTRKQWRIKYDHIAEHLREEQFTYPEERAAIRHIRTDYEAIGDLLSGIVQNRERKRNSEREAAIAHEQERMLVNGLMITSQSLMNRSFEIAKMIREEESRFHEIFHFLILLSTSIIAVGLLAISLVLARRVVRPITTLHKGTEVIGSGDLDYRVGTNVKDEIGQLSRAFDAMTGNLKAITVSRDELNREINERKIAEQALERSNRELERRLQEIKTLRGILPICSYCKKIKDDKGAWQQMELYVRDHSEAEFTHGMCPVCEEKAFKEAKEFGKKKQ